MYASKTVSISSLSVSHLSYHIVSTEVFQIHSLQRFPQPIWNRLGYFKHFLSLSCTTSSFPFRSLGILGDGTLLSPKITKKKNPNIWIMPLNKMAFYQDEVSTIRVQQKNTIEERPIWSWGCWEKVIREASAGITVCAGIIVEEQRSRVRKPTKGTQNSPVLNLQSCFVLLFVNYSI